VTSSHTRSSVAKQVNHRVSGSSPRHSPTGAATANPGGCEPRNRRDSVRAHRSWWCSHPCGQAVPSLGRNLVPSRSYSGPLGRPLLTVVLRAVGWTNGRELVVARARRGENHLCRKRKVRSARRKRPPRRPHTPCLRAWVTSTRARWREVERHQNDTSIVVARAWPKITMTTLEKEPQGCQT
jgi:hypothetical protein